MSNHSRQSSICTSMLLSMVVSLGCSSGERSFSRDGAESRQETCSTPQKIVERDRVHQLPCESSHTWSEKLKLRDVLNGTATILRTPAP